MPRIIDLTEAMARQRGPLAAGHFRALVLEPDGRLTHHDFPSLTAARAYAADASAETEDDRGSPLVYVFDDAFVLQRP